MVLELIERVLAALIILGLLVIVLFLAFPDRSNGVTSPDRRTVETPRIEPSRPVTERPVVPDPSTSARPRETSETPQGTAAGRGDSQTAKKIQDRLRSSKKMAARNGASRNQTTISRMRPRSQQNKRVPPVERYLKHADYRNPWRQHDDYECVGDRCACDCNRPYWSQSGPACWD